MKKFKFRLQRILEYRDTLKKEKERELAERNAELHTRKTMRDQIMDAQENTQVPQGEEISMAELNLTGDYLRYLQDSLVSQRLMVLEAANAVDSARDAYIEKAVEAESLETLKRKRQKEWKVERRREERKELDKLTVQRYRFKSAGMGNGGNEGEDNG